MTQSYWKTSSLSPEDALCLQKSTCSPGQDSALSGPRAAAGFPGRGTAVGSRNRTLHVSRDRQAWLHLTGKLLPLPAAQWAQSFTWWEAFLATRKLWNIFESFQFQVAFLEQPAAGRRAHLWLRYSQSPTPHQGNLESKQVFCQPVFTVKTPLKILTHLQNRQLLFLVIF